jgi:hypothetical protein
MVRMRFPKISKLDRLAVGLFLLLIALLIASGGAPRVLIYQSF